MARIEIHGTTYNQSSAPDIGYQFQENGAPWYSVEGAHNGCPEPYRAIGKIRYIDLADGKGIIEYWYKDGVAMSNLVPRYGAREEVITLVYNNNADF